jgi:hypothetical protein
MLGNLKTTMMHHVALAFQQLSRNPRFSSKLATAILSWKKAQIPKRMAKSLSLIIL